MSARIAAAIAEPAVDGVPDAYRLDGSGTVIYQAFGERWHDWDSHLPLVIGPTPEQIEHATPLFLRGQATEA